MNTTNSTHTDRSLIVIGGSAGGVGKSLVSMAIIDWLTSAKGAKVLVVDGDPDTADVYKPYKSNVPKPIPLNLDIDEGWLVLADSCDEHSDAHVVVNTGARNLESMLRYSATSLVAASDELNRRVAVLWVIDSRRGSVALLKKYLNDRSDRCPLHVVCNQGEDDRRSFDHFMEESARWDNFSGEAIVVPTLAKRVTKQLYMDRKTLAALSGREPSGTDSRDDQNRRVPFGTRLEVRRWTALVWRRLDDLRIVE